MTKTMQWRRSKVANSAVIIASMHSNKHVGNISTKEALSIEYSSFFHPSQLVNPICAMASVKFIFSKKATEIDKIFTVDLMFTTLCQIDGEGFMNFVAFLESMKFRIE